MTTPNESPIYYPTPDNGGAGPDPKPGGSAADPTLSMLWTNGYVPAFTGPPDGTGGSTGTSGPTPGSHAALSVDLGSLMVSVSSGSTNASEVVDAYNALKAKVDSVVASTTFWGQQANTGPTTWYDNSGVAGGVGPIARTGVFPDKGIQEAAAKFAPVMNPELTHAVRQVADATELYGVYLARMDLAGQSYAAADYGSILPDVTPMPKT